MIWMQELGLSIRPIHMLIAVCESMLCQPPPPPSFIERRPPAPTLLYRPGVNRLTGSTIARSQRIIDSAAILPEPTAIIDKQFLASTLACFCRPSLSTLAKGDLVSSWLHRTGGCRLCFLLQYTTHTHTHANGEAGRWLVCQGPWDQRVVLPERSLGSWKNPCYIHTASTSPGARKLGSASFCL